MKVFCLLGDDRAQRSKSPILHNKAFQTRGIDAHYVSFCVSPELLKNSIIGFRALGLCGANVTIPHKENVVSFLDELGPTAKILKAVNTLIVSNGLVIGDNTDVDGFRDALSTSGFSPEKKSCLVIGTGGAAKAVVLALSEMGVGKIKVAGRNTSKLLDISKMLEIEPMSMKELVEASRTAELIVNATSMSSPDEFDNSMSGLVASLDCYQLELIFDLNYGRSENIWEIASNRMGCKFSHGLVMLAAQAARSFNLWTGESATVSEFTSYLR